MSVVVSLSIVVVREVHCWDVSSNLWSFIFVLSFVPRSDLLRVNLIVAFSIS